MNKGTRDSKEAEDLTFERGGEPMASGVYQTFHLAMFVFAKYPHDLATRDFADMENTLLDWVVVFRPKRVAEPLSCSQQPLSACYHVTSRSIRLSNATASASTSPRHPNLRRTWQAFFWIFTLRHFLDEATKQGLVQILCLYNKEPWLCLFQIDAPT